VDNLISLENGNPEIIKSVYDLVHMYRKVNILAK